MSDRPIWRRDFPYRSDAEEDITRREFTRFLVMTSGAFAAGGAGMSLWASLRRVNVGEARKIAVLTDLGVGGSFLFRYPGPKDPAILIRPEGGLVLGFSQKCTHLGCVVLWEGNHFECPCHDGVFSAEGDPIAGPPVRGLERIDVEVRGEEIWALGVETT